MGCGVQKNFIENTKMLTECPTFNSSDDSGLDMYKNSLLTNLTFKGPCIVLYSYNKTNEMH